jgi:BirA family biotin operon repressor/biotin-[acetyl-CoA-carboxylase] ligase
VIVATPFLSRTERFAAVGSTNDLVRDWLAQGTPEVCLAIADEQTAGRGRNGRTWTAPAGTGLLLSLGFRPTWIEPDAAWRLPAIVSLAMADACERVVGLSGGTIALKWPNDLVIVDHGSGRPSPGAAVRKLGGVLGETSGLGTADPTAIVGIGLNVDWRGHEIPAELAGSMTSLADATDRGDVDAAVLLDTFVVELERRLDDLRAGGFDGADWQRRQLTTNRTVEIQDVDGNARVARALGVDARSGALVVDDGGVERPVFVGEITRVRLASV